MTFLEFFEVFIDCVLVYVIEVVIKGYLLFKLILFVFFRLLSVDSFILVILKFGLESFDEGREGGRYYCF